MKGACVKACVLLPVRCPSPDWRTGKVRAEPTLHLQGLDLSSCHFHIYGDFIDGSFPCQLLVSISEQLTIWNIWILDHNSFWSDQFKATTFLGSGSHSSAPGHDQVRHTYCMLLNGSENEHRLGLNLDSCGSEWWILLKLAFEGGATCFHTGAQWRGWQPPEKWAVLWGFEELWWDSWWWQAY